MKRKNQEKEEQIALGSDATKSDQHVRISEIQMDEAKHQGQRSQDGSDQLYKSRLRRSWTEIMCLLI